MLNTYWWVWWWSLLWWLEVMLLHIDVRNNVIILKGVLAWSEVPWLFLGVVIPALKSFQFIIKVDHIVSLLIPQGGVFIASQNVNHILLLGLFNCCLCLRTSVNLRNWVVKGFLLFNELVGHLLVSRLFTLKTTLLINVFIHITLPLLQAFW